jgi:hypothetical protein
VPEVIVANMRLYPIGFKFRHILWRMLPLLALSVAHYSYAQNVPIISGAAAFTTSTNGGNTSYSPLISPLVAAPIGHRFMFETRDFILDPITPRSGQSYQTHIIYGVNTLQMDYVATDKLTLVGGKFLIPFGTYNERLTPVWIGNFQDTPLIFNIGTLANGMATGGMVRGSALSTPKVNIDYAAYLSSTITDNQFSSSHGAGGRVDVYFPEARLEVGASYTRQLQNVNTNFSGFHVWWEPANLPLRVRSEYAHGAHSQGYWIETTYRLSQWKGPNSILGRLEPGFRMQQTFRNSPDPSDGLPAADTQKTDFAMNYYLPHEVRLINSFSRQFSSTGNRNIWETGIVYRFLFPAWKGKK